MSWKNPPTLAWTLKPRKFTQVYASFNFESGDWLIFCWFSFFSFFLCCQFFSVPKQNSAPFQHKPTKHLNQHFSKIFNSVSNLPSSSIWSFEGVLNTLHSLGMPSVWPLHSMQCETDYRGALMQYPASVQTFLPDFPEFRISFCLYANAWTTQLGEFEPRETPTMQSSKAQEGSKHQELES